MPDRERLRGTRKGWSHEGPAPKDGCLPIVLTAAVAAVLLFIRKL